MATVRDDHYAVVVDLETMICFPRIGSRHRKAKHCTLRIRNPVCRRAFQLDLETIQVGTAGTHVNEHHAVCMRAIQYLARKYSGCQKQGDCRVLWGNASSFLYGIQARRVSFDGSCACASDPQSAKPGLFSSGEHASFFKGVV